MANEPLKVGLDLDGVILYNPTRFVRPIITTFKRKILKKKETKFRVFKKPWEQFIWTLLHKTSIYVAPGFEDFKKLAKAKKIKAYIITSRYEFLKHDFQEWLKEIHASEYFEACYYNENNLQPHIYKENKLKELKLDYFVDDNFDIVKHLNETEEKNGISTKILWIYNFLDRTTEYPYKFPVLKKAIDYIISTEKL